jgi:type IV pilus assembly protein PilX
MSTLSVSSRRGRSHTGPAVRRSQRGSTLVLVIIALTVLLVSAVVILRSSGVATTVAGNIAFRAAANQAAEVAINTAVTTIQTAESNGTFNGDTGAGLPSGSYFALMQTTDSAGIPQVSTWPTATTTGQFSLQWIVDRLCSSTPVTDPTSQCRTAQGSQSGNSVAAGAVQFPTPPRVFYRITAMVTGPKGAVSYVQALVEL